MTTTRGATGRAHPSTLVGVVCLGWMGAVIFIIGLLVLGKEIYTWFMSGAWSHFRLVSVFEFISSLLDLSALPDEHGPFSLLVAVSKVIPLSLALMGVGWCLYQIAEMAWDLTHKSEEPT